MKSFKAQFIKGTFWTAINQFSITFMNFAISLVLARLIAPEEFGTLGLILVFSGFATVLIDSGLNSAVIKFNKLNEKQLSSIFWMMMFIGTGAFLLFAILAYPIALFYNNPSLVSYTILIATTFFISSLGNIQSALLYKNLKFKQTTLTGIVAVLISGLTAIILAWNGYGIWALVLQRIVLAAVTAGLFWFLSGWKPSFYFNLKDVKQIWGFSSNLLYIGSFNYWTLSIDNLLIGKVFGEEPLGFYSRGHVLVRLPSTLITAVLSKVAFPMFSKVQDDLKQIGNATLKITYLIALFIFPATLVLYLHAEPVIRILYGEAWIPSAILFKYLTPSIPFLCLASMNGAIYQSQGNTRMQFKVNVVSKVFIILLIVVGVFFDTKTIAMLFTIGTVLSYFYMMYFPLRLINVKMSQYLRSISVLFLITILLGLFHLLVLEKLSLFEEFSFQLNFILQSATILVLYILATITLERRKIFSYLLNRKTL